MKEGEKNSGLVNESCQSIINSPNNFNSKEQLVEDEEGNTNTGRGGLMSHISYRLSKT